MHTTYEWGMGMLAVHRYCRGYVTRIILVFTICDLIAILNRHANTLIIDLDVEEETGKLTYCLTIANYES